jgi:hypothetical protein
MSIPPGTEIFQFPGFASPHYGFMWRYPKGVGCPIRTSTDQRLLAAPRGFSQRATSFIASWCQGIHRMPFSRSRHAPGHRSGGLHHAQKPSSAINDHRSPNRKESICTSRFTLAQHTTVASERSPRSLDAMSIRSDNASRYVQRRTRT